MNLSEQIEQTVAEMRARVDSMTRAIVLARLRENLRALGFANVHQMTDEELIQSVVAFQKVLHNG